MRFGTSTQMSTVDDAGAGQSHHPPEPRPAPDIIEVEVSLVFQILERLARVVESRDYLTGGHTLRVGMNAMLIGLAMELPIETVDRLRRAAPLHDIGKIAVPDAILLKPGELTAAEFETMKSHTTIGAAIFDDLRTPLLRMAKDVALTHHERWDGTGYAGLTGEAIPLSGRIVAVADTFDALTHARPYRRALSAGEATSEILKGTGTQFDPTVVDAFLSVVDRNDLAGGV